MISSSLANAQAQERLRFRARFEEALRQIAVSASPGKLSERELSRLVAEQLSELLDAGGTAVRFEADGMRMLCACGPAAPLAGRPVDPRSVVVEVARRGRTVISDDYSEFGSAYDALARDCGAQSAVAVPIRVGDQLWGKPQRDDDPRRPVGRPVELLGRFAQIMSVALANAQAQEQLRFRVRLEQTLREVAVASASGDLSEQSRT
jgi:GAF domain-containing protein